MQTASPLRSFAAVYIGVNALYLYPRYAKEAFSSAWPWLLRYSNAWVLLMTAVGLMVSACASPFVQLLSASAEVCWLLSAKLCSPNCALPIVSQLSALPIVSSAAHLLEIWCRHCCSCQYQHHDRLYPFLVQCLEMCSYPQTMNSENFNCLCRSVPMCMYPCS